LSNLKKKKLDKPISLGFLKDIMEALDHIHISGNLHNDLKSNNVVMKQRKQEWNPIIFDFGKAPSFPILSQ